MTTFASVYSGIGGADAGFCAAGWDVRWQCEADPYRRTILTRHFGVPVYDAIETLVDIDLPRVDLLYGELPDHRIAMWWPQFARVAKMIAPQWLVCEMSPTVRCERVLVDLALDGWAIRLMHLRVAITAKGMIGSDTDVRNRALVIAARDGDALDAIKLASNYAELIINGHDIDHERLSLPWHEEGRGFKAGYTCACGIEPCACGSDVRISALADATSPCLSHWLAEVIDGAWSDGVERQITRADGTGA